MVWHLHPLVTNHIGNEAMHDICAVDYNAVNIFQAVLQMHVKLDNGISPVYCIMRLIGCNLFKNTTLQFSSSKKGENLSPMNTPKLKCTFVEYFCHNCV